MASLEEFKSQNPAYKDVPDQQLADALHKKYYSSIPKEDFYQKVGYASAPEAGSDKEEIADRLTAAARTTAQGRTLGFSDELIGGAKALGIGAARGIEKAVYGDNLIPETSYKEQRDIERQELDKAREKYPVQSFFTEAAGSFKPSAEILKTTGLTGGLRKNLIGGGVLSGIYGAGQAKDISDVPEKAAAGAAEGIAVTGALHGAAQAGKAIMNVAKKAFNGSSAQAIAEKVINPEEAKKLASKLTNAEETGRQTDIADIGGDELAGLTRLLAKTPGSKNIINEYFNNRSSGSSRRVRNAISDKISSQEYFGNADDIIKARKELSSPLYEKAEAEFPEIPTLYKSELSNISRARSVEGKPITDFNKTEIAEIARREIQPETFKTGNSSVPARAPNIRDAAEEISNMGNMPPRERFPSKADPYLGINEPNLTRNKSYKGGESTVGMDYATGIIPKRYSVESNISERLDPYSPIKSTYDQFGQKVIKPITEGDRTVVSSRKSLQNTATDTSGYLGKALTPKERQVATKFQPLIEDPRIQGAYKIAQREYGIGDAPITSFKALDGIKKALDDVSGNAKRLGEGEKAREFTSLKHKLVNFLDDLSPTYKEARKTFAGHSELLEAQEMGRNFNKEFETAAELKRHLKNLTSGEIDTFKVGVTRNLLSQVGETADASSAASKIFAKPEMRDKLKVIFNNPKEYASFARKMTDEIRISKTKQRILGGSRTDINLADEANIIGKAAQGLITNPKGTIINAVVDSFKKRYMGLNDRNARELAQTFTNRKKSIDMLLKIAKKADPEQQKIINQAINDYMPDLTAAQLSASGVAVSNQ